MFKQWIIPIRGNAVIYHGPCLFGQCITLDTTADYIDSLGGSSQTLEIRILEEYILDIFQGFIGVKRLLDRLFDMRGHIR